MVGIIGYMSGGKTYTAVEMMLNRLNSGHPVVSNIKLKCRETTSYLQIPCLEWKRLYFQLVDDSDWTGEYHTLPYSKYQDYPVGSPRGSATYEQDKVYIFIDEVSSLFDSMIAASNAGIQEVAAWARHTEKRGQMVYLIMQFQSELHKRLRVHVTQYIKCVNTSMMKIPLLGTHLPFFMQGLLVRTDWLPDMETMLGAATWSKYDPRVYNCYNTAQIVVGHKSVDYKIQRPDVGDKLFLQMLLRMVIVFAVFYTITLLFALWKLQFSTN